MNKPSETTITVASILLLAAMGLMATESNQQAPSSAPRATFGVEVLGTNEATTRAITNGAFWTEWRLETNIIPAAIQTNNMRPPPMDTMFRAYCPLVHLDTTIHEETLSVTSNLYAWTVWRGQTNRQLLEYKPVTNIIRHWRYEAVKSYLP